MNRQIISKSVLYTTIVSRQFDYKKLVINCCIFRHFRAENNDLENITRGLGNTLNNNDTRHPFNSRYCMSCISTTPRSLVVALYCCGAILYIVASLCNVNMSSTHVKVSDNSFKTITKCARIHTIINHHSTKTKTT